MLNQDAAAKRLLRYNNLFSFMLPSKNFLPRNRQFYQRNQHTLKEIVYYLLIY